MRKIIIVFAAVTAVVAAASCAKETPSVEGGIIELSVTGILEECQSAQTKSSLVNNIRVKWENGDKVLVIDESNTKFLGTLTAAVEGGETRVAKLSGSILAPSGGTLIFIHGTGINPDDYTQDWIYTSVSASLAEQGTDTPFVVVGEAALSSADVSGIIVPFKFATTVISAFLTGLPASEDLGQIEVRGFNTKCSISTSDCAIGGNTVGSIKLSSKGKTNANGQAALEIAVPISMSATRSLSVLISSKSYVGTLTGVSIPCGYSYDTIVEMHPSISVDEFSVSDTKKVIFAKGDLYWNGSAFRFEGNQYDYPTAWNENHVSHFYWSKDVAVARAKTYSDESLTKSDVLFTNATATTPNPEFEVNGEKGVWRSLSQYEVDYMTSQRSGHDDKWGAATITTARSSFKGFILLPDEWILPDGCTFKAGSSNQYSLDEWVVMEQAGAVFFCSSGYRNNDYSFVDSQTITRHWLSDYNSSESPEDDGVCGITTGTNGPAVIIGLPETAFPIRLVKDVN